MPYTPTDLEAFVRQRAPEVAKEIRAAAERSGNEADLVAAVERILKRFARNFDVSLSLQRERTLINGRADAVYNRFVIEYEPPNSLRKERNARTNQHAIEQVKQYLGGLERVDRQKKERLAGVALDGSYYIFVRYRDGHWHEDDPLPVNAQSTETFLRYLLALATEKALTPENLMDDFGEHSEVARCVMPALYGALCATDHPKVNTLFRQWQRQFHEISGYEKGSARLDVGALAKAYAVHPSPQPSPASGRGGGEVDAERLFYALHTYYATFIKLLAVQIAHYYLMPKLGTGLAEVANRESEGLRRYLMEMERGGVFATFGIKNLLEGDFFGWYMDIWDDDIDGAMRRLIGDLAAYSLVTLDVDPEETRDLLKQLYQNLMPRKLRHALGEYYTPDWLAERLLNQLGYQGDPGKRLLDPACGSGTFLVLAIKRVRRYAEDKMLPPADVLEQVLTNIVGYDLNPLAVISARTNYLLALGDLLPHRRGEINIPVYLADSILTPSQATTTGGQTGFLKAGSTEIERPGYSFNTAVGRFTVPGNLVTAERIDRFAELLEDAVRSGNSEEVFQKRLERLWPDLPRDQAPTAGALYATLADLERQGINGIWARIIKNAFAPLFQGRFDYVAGNPPWVNWESLPEEYRQETKPLWVHHGLFPHSGMDTILGKGKKDISMLMSYVAMDNYLADGGRLGFVITQSVFKTAGAGQGFRRFQLGSGTRVAVVSVDDMADLKPFEGAANRTAIVILERGRPTRYPMRSYSLWYKRGGGSVIPEDTPMEDIGEIASYRQYVAQPVDHADPTSPWITGRRLALQAVEKVLGRSDYEAKAGVCTWLNGVYWLEIVAERPESLVVVRNITEGAKREVESVQAAVEPDLLFPLLRGRDVSRWQATPQAHILMVQDPEKRRGYGEEWLSAAYPRSYAYLKHFEEVLRTRSGYRRYFSEADPFYSLFDIGDYTFAPYKVVWPWISPSLVSAVVSDDDKDRVVVPEHNTSFVAFSGADEAHFFCACFNSRPAGFAAISSYSGGGGGIASPKVVERIGVPRYDPANPTHRQLAALSQEAHAATAAGEAARVREIEGEIDRLVAQLWGLTEAELGEIQRNLEELG